MTRALAEYNDMWQTRDDLRYTGESNGRAEIGVIFDDALYKRRQTPSMARTSSSSSRPCARWAHTCCNGDTADQLRQRAPDLCGCARRLRSTSASGR